MRVINDSRTWVRGEITVLYILVGTLYDQICFQYVHHICGIFSYGTPLVTPPSSQIVPYVFRLKAFNIDVWYLSLYLASESPS